MNASHTSPHTLSLTQPDDWHVHLRDGVALQAVVAHTAAQFARALVMPNLKPPITSTELAMAYRQRIMAALPEGATFDPLMSLYLTDTLPPDEITRAKDAGVVACKLYPAGATTHSDAGVTDLRKISATLEAMQRHGLLLLVHGEVTDSTVDLFDREAVFIERHLIPLRRDFPELKIVMEHITTQEAAQFVAQADGPTAATIPPTICCSTAMPCFWAACARTTTVCPCSSAKPTGRLWSRPPPRAARGFSWAPTALRTRRT